jgi:hypothetical protein
MAVSSKNRISLPDADKLFATKVNCRGSSRDRRSFSHWQNNGVFVMTTNSTTAEDRLVKLGIHLLVRTCLPFRRGTYFS